jgi:hypothetical protein
MRSLGRPELATVVLAVIRGLLVDLDATGDAARSDQAFHDFLAAIDGARPSRPAGSRSRQRSPARRPVLRESSGRRGPAAPTSPGRGAGIGAERTGARTEAGEDVVAAAIEGARATAPREHPCLVELAR